MCIVQYSIVNKFGFAPAELLQNCINFNRGDKAVIFAVFFSLATRICTFAAPSCLFFFFHIQNVFTKFAENHQMRGGLFYRPLGI